ncbi:unnamed protein product [Prorocentrum cordatum]|uniref:Uncharacterized protein n=1 Tax=Prorocentrum cordatum TaxID=2364126 RepID=A0ABN9PAU2_9DINO|nr:unnamed protein product [Polarella glacialis]
MKPQNILERHLRRRRRRRKRRREEEEGGRKEEGNVKAALKDAREVGAESTRSPRRPRRALQKPARARRRRARPRAWARGSAAGGPNRVGRKGRIAQGGGGGGGEGEEEGEEVGALGAQGHPGHTSTSPEVSRVLPRSGPEREAPARGFTRPGPPLFQGRGARGPRPRRLHCARQAPTQGGGGGRGGGGGGWRSRRPVVNHRGAARRLGPVLTRPCSRRGRARSLDGCPSGGRGHSCALPPEKEREEGQDEEKIAHTVGALT